jgi:hypothetical protein
MKDKKFHHGGIVKLRILRTKRVIKGNSACVCIAIQLWIFRNEKQIEHSVVLEKIVLVELVAASIDTAANKELLACEHTDSVGRVRAVRVSNWQIEILRIY